MSILESQSKELILSLAYGRRSILEIEDEEALLLARWTVKTAYVLHTSANWRPVVPDEHIYRLDHDSYHLPERVYVVGHTLDQKRTSKESQFFSWSQSTSWPILFYEDEPSKENLKVLRTKGYKIGLRLGGLFVMVVHNPWEFAHLCLSKWKHVPLYPRRSHPVVWQIDNEDWPEEAATRFHVFTLGLSLHINATK
ncbi:MAG TPA: hypothetical protein VIS99_03660 [Terrimicrobiaceae bacterium]